MAKKKVVVALGHKALGTTLPEQKSAVKKTAAIIADLVEAGAELVITHSNAPQVGMIHTAMNEFGKVHSDYTAVPMYDDAFHEPVKVIGRVLTEEEAELEEQKGNYVTKVEGGYRRIVAAPKPQDVVEIDAIRTLSDAGQIVIACGGGGIPVLEQQASLNGASAVIEKDLVSGKLAELLDAEELLILTSVEKVSLNYQSDKEEKIEKMDVETAKKYMQENQFGASTMLPKVEAAVSFVEKKAGRKAVITSIDRAKDGFLGKTGTVIE